MFSILFCIIVRYVDLCLSKSLWNHVNFLQVLTEKLFRTIIARTNRLFGKLGNQLCKRFLKFSWKFLQQKFTSKKNGQPSRRWREKSFSIRTRENRELPSSEHSVEITGFYSHQKEISWNQHTIQYYMRWFHAIFAKKWWQQISATSTLCMSVSNWDESLQRKFNSFIGRHLVQICCLENCKWIG